jgi:hypothetical protein
MFIRALLAALIVASAIAPGAPSCHHHHHQRRTHETRPPPDMTIARHFCPRTILRRSFLLCEKYTLAFEGSLKKVTHRVRFGYATCKNHELPTLAPRWHRVGPERPRSGELVPFFSPPLFMFRLDKYSNCTQFVPIQGSAHRSFVMIEPPLLLQ